MSNDRDLISHGRKLVEARAAYEAMVDAIPVGTSIDVEFAAVDAAVQPVRALAAQIEEIPATTNHGHGVKAEAHAFLGGVRTETR